MAQPTHCDAAPVRRQVFLKSVAAALLVLYLAGACVLFFWPDGADIHDAMIDLWRLARRLGLPQGISPHLFSALANGLVFIPPVFSGTVLVPRISWWTWWATSVLCTGGIEFVQLAVLTARQADVADLAANAAGGLVGALLGRAALRFVAQSSCTAGST